eukprot:6201275-Pleurochrysis_carterae.AAC.1
MFQPIPEPFGWPRAWTAHPRIFARPRRGRPSLTITHPAHTTRGRRHTHAHTRAHGQCPSVPQYLSTSRPLLSFQSPGYLLANLLARTNHSVLLVSATA